MVALRKQISSLHRLLCHARCLVLLFILASLSSCSPGRAGGSIEERLSPRSEDEKIRVEAYLFDAKLRRDGKPTSLRLELYHADTAVGLYARGYLGKTGLKGYLDHDSLLVYFPRSDEFVAGPIVELLTSLPCELNSEIFDLFTMIRNLPDSRMVPPQVNVESDFSKAKRPRFVLSVPECDWKILLAYDQKSDNWRLREFEYRNGEGTNLKASRRNFRSRAKVSASLLDFRIPATAVRVSP